MVQSPTELSVPFEGTSSGSEWLGGALGLVSAGIDAGTDIYVNNKNLDYQRETNLKNEALMRESWAREDNAVQRRVADLKKAGLSPTLAAGSSAASGSPVSMVAPKSSLRGGYGAQTLAALSAVKQLKQQTQEIESLKIANENARKQGQLLDLDISNYGLPWQLKLVNTLLDKFTGKDLFSFSNYVYNGLKDPVSGFITPGSFTFNPSSGVTSGGKKAIENAVNEGYAEVKSDGDGSNVVVFDSKEAAKRWYLSIGGTTAEWYQGIREYGSPEGYLDWILGSGGWYFK